MLFYFQRERAQAGERWREREGERENLKQVPHSAQSPMGNLNPWPWDHDLSQNQESDIQLIIPPSVHHRYFFLDIEFEGPGQHNAISWRQMRSTKGKRTFPFAYEIIIYSEKLTGSRTYINQKKKRKSWGYQTTLQKWILLFIPGNMLQGKTILIKG